MSSNYFNKLFKAEEIDLNLNSNPSSIIFFEETFWLNRNNSDIEPVINFYKKSNLLKVVNGEALIPEINNEISGLIDGI